MWEKLAQALGIDLSKKGKGSQRIFTDFLYS